LTATITVYTQPSCGPCAATKRHLDKAEVAYETIDIRESPLAATLLRERGFTGTPVVIGKVGDREYAWQDYRSADLDALIYLVKEGDAA